jgi:hypothetical protein
MSPYYDGYTTPETNKICIRCAKLHNNIFYKLCDKCRAADEMDVADLEEQRIEERDRQMMISDMRGE